MYKFCTELQRVVHSGGLLSSRLDPLYGITQSLDPTGADNSPPIGRRHSADLFASVGLNAQFGRFKRNFWDFTKMGIRLDIGAVSALKLHKMQDVSPSSNGESGDIGDERGHPTLALELQQQVLFVLLVRGFTLMIMSLYVEKHSLSHLFSPCALCNTTRTSSTSFAMRVVAVKFIEVCRSFS